MKDLIKKVLADALDILEKQVPSTKKKTMYSSSIMDMNPLDLPEFIKNNDIPAHATFDGVDNGYDGWEDFVLSWDIDVPTTDKDKLKFKRKRFTTIAFKLVYETLTKNGYKRVGYSSGLLKEFDDTTVYDMAIAEDYDRIVKYYSLPFVIDSK